VFRVEQASSVPGLYFDKEELGQEIRKGMTRGGKCFKSNMRYGRGGQRGGK